jgi:hypothetical protein
MDIHDYFSLSPEETTENRPATPGHPGLSNSGGSRKPVQKEASGSVKAFAPVSTICLALRSSLPSNLHAPAKSPLNSQMNPLIISHVSINYYQKAFQPIQEEK